MALTAAAVERIGTALLGARRPLVVTSYCRTPHLWLRDGLSLYDALGPDYTLLRLDPAAEVGGIVAAAAQKGVPLAVLDVDAEGAAALYGRKLVLSRPDQHVAWRGDEQPADPLEIIDRVRGASVRGELLAA